MAPDWSVLGLGGRSRDGIGQQVQESRWRGMEDGEVRSSHRKCRRMVS